MKIIHVIPSLAVGGAEMCLARLVTARRRNAPEAIVVTLLPDIGSHLERLLKDSKIRHEVIGVRGVFDLPKAVARMASLIRTEKPQCVQSWLYYGDIIATLGLLLSGRRSATRLCWGVRCSDLQVDNYGFQLSMAIGLCRRLSRIPDAIVANSFAGRDVHRDLGYEADKLTVIHNGIDVDVFTPSFDDHIGLPNPHSGLNRPTVGIAGRVDPQKGYATFLCVVDQLPLVNIVAAGKDTNYLPARPNLVSLGVCTDMPRFIQFLTQSLGPVPSPCPTTSTYGCFSC